MVRRFDVCPTSRSHDRAPHAAAGLQDIIDIRPRQMERRREALYEQLAKDPPPARAKRRAYRDLLRSAGGPHQQQIRDVGARNDHD
jgi:hypothetical protein